MSAAQLTKVQARTLRAIIAITDKVMGETLPKTWRHAEARLRELGLVDYAVVGEPGDIRLAIVPTDEGRKAVAS